METSIMRKVRFIMVLFILAMAQCPAPAASDAQPAGVAKTDTTGQAPRAKRRRTRPADLLISSLDVAPRLPGVPLYTGKEKFVQGRAMNHARSGPTVNLVFHVKERPVQVIKWWRQALSEGNWQLQPDMPGSNSNTISAVDDQMNACQVIVEGGHGSDGCDYQLFYKFHISAEVQ